MAKHRIERSTELPISLDEAWKFFSTPRNLAKITPTDLGFSIQEPFDDQAVYSGQRITYTVRPVLGIPLTWVTVIEDVEPMKRFVDVQAKGPYRLWRHEHLFEPTPKGVLMRDVVEYELPLGWLGEIAHRTFVSRQLDRIFAYREEVLDTLFRKQERTGTGATLLA